MMVTIVVKRGSVHLARPIYERFFAGRETVILLRNEADLLILPARSAAAGGYMIKTRNKAGDRVVHAADFFRENGFDDEREQRFEVTWSDEHGGLSVAGVFELQT